MKDHARGFALGCGSLILAVSLVVWPIAANGQGKGQGKGGGGQSSSAPQGRSAGELPPGLERYESKRGDELPRGLEKREERKGALPKGLESGGKKTTKQDQETKKQRRAKAKTKSKGKTSEEFKSKSPR